jgi:inactivated superfamily I helicase
LVKSDFVKRAADLLNFLVRGRSIEREETTGYPVAMDDPATAQRWFLGASSPALPAAVRWLTEALPGGSAALGEALIVVPGGRAQRRLMELLAEHAQGEPLVPPTIVTLGGMARRLLPAGGSAVAGELASLLAWSSVLREAEPGLLAEFIPNAPGRDDWPGWWALAEQIAHAADELSAQLLSFQDAAERLADQSEAGRWSALAELDRRYHALLAERGWVDAHAALRDAIETGACEHDAPVVLVATADLQPVHERALSCLASPVHALVFADESDAAGFDRWGGLVDAYWSARPQRFGDAQLSFADRPSDQAAAVLSTIGGWAHAHDTPADAITVGLGDASLAGPVGRTLAFAGLPVRHAAGKPVGKSRPVLLLKALADFADGLRFDKLAALLRHPDAERYVVRQSDASPASWLILLDRYASDHLAARPVGGWLGEPETARAMDAVYQSARSLLPEPVNAQRALDAWAEPIGQALSAVYGERRLNRHAEEDRPVVAALDAIGGVLEQLVALDAAHAPHCTFAQAVALVAKRVAGAAIPEPGGTPAIELVGYLELLLDDAPHLVLAGMNEQHVPQPPRHSALISEGVRRELGLPGDTHRLARDGYALSAILGCRAESHTRLVAGRRTSDGEPLLPSRLLLAADDDTLVRRVSDFVDEQGESEISASTMLTPGKSDRFLIPRPAVPDKPITTLSVTAFRDYLACPYRFYLKHVLRLQALDDQALEVPATHFGTLAHRALQTLAAPDARAIDDAEALAARLSSALDRAFTKAFGHDPPVAARVQLEQLRYRLSSFAPLQAKLVREGWRITEHERAYETTIEVDGKPFTIKGQVDRIDRHESGAYRVIDYKTADSAKSPEQTHRKTVDGARVWSDLQLPLYLDLLAGQGVDRSAELGYINLPKKTGDTSYVAAGWSADELESASETRDFVIRQVRAGVFWPPGDPPNFDDGLAGICGDAAMDRPGLVRASRRDGGGGAS